MGSCNEIQTQTELAGRFNYISIDLRNQILEEALQVYKMILGFYNSLRDD